MQWIFLVLPAFWLIVIIVSFVDFMGPTRGDLKNPPCPLPPPTRLPPPPPPKPTRTETVDGTDYILREEWWFEQFPVDKIITLELCYDYGVEWIYSINPSLKPKEAILEEWVSDENSMLPAAIYIQRKNHSNGIHVEINGKKIIAEPIKKLLVQGDAYSQIIVFTLDKYDGGFGLTGEGFSYEINGMNSNAKSAANKLEKGDHADPSKFTLTWNVGPQFTQAAYGLTIWISATKEMSDGTTLKWSTYPATIFVHEGFVANDCVDVADQLSKNMMQNMIETQCNVNSSHRDLELAIAQCCCTTDTDRTRLMMESCCQSTESQINELRQQLCEQRGQMQANELFWRTQVMTAPPIYPAVPNATYGYWGGCGYNGREL